MINQYEAKCAKCKKTVRAGEGKTNYFNFEWRTEHGLCPSDESNHPKEVTRLNTPICLLGYPVLYEPKLTKKGAWEYSCVLFFPKTKPIEWLKKFGVKLSETEHFWSLRVKAKDCPALVDKGLRPVGSNEMTSGSYCVAVIDLKPYVIKGKNIVSAHLVALQKLIDKDEKHVEISGPKNQVAAQD